MSRIFYFAKFFASFVRGAFSVPGPRSKSGGWSLGNGGDVDGRKIQAVLRGVKDDRVILFKDGREYVFPLSRLSERDREFVIKHRQRSKRGIFT